MLDTLGPTLIGHGYLPIPIRPREKRPALRGWQNERLTPEDCARWPDHGVGLLCGVGEYPLAAFDLDTLDADLAAEFEAWCFEHLGPAPVRIGQWPKRLLLYRAAEAGWLKASSAWFEDMLGDRHRLEVLGAGQQFVAFGVHPSGVEYEWRGARQPAGGGAEALTVVTAEQVREAIAEFTKRAGRRGYLGVPSKTPGFSAAPPNDGRTDRTTRSPGEEGEGTHRDGDPLSTYQPAMGLSINEARAVLDASGLDASVYEEWLRAGMALHHEGSGGEDWWALWDEWSSTAPNYRGWEDIQLRWRSFGQGQRFSRNPVTMRALVAAAQSRGAMDRGAVAALGKAQRGSSGAGSAGESEPPVKALLADFQAYLPEHKYLYVPTGALWPATSVNVGVDWPVDAAGNALAPAKWLDKWRPVVQMTWAPGEPQIIEGRLVADGGWAEQPGARVFNQYRPPVVLSGDSRAAGPWRDHLRLLYPAPGEAEHIERWFAHRLQAPHVKVNHALMLGGGQGIGKDTLCEPLKHGVGPWNWAEISPSIMCGAFTGWRQNVVVRVNEIHDLGETSRFAFYEATKTLSASPPDTLPVNLKHRAEYQVLNVMGLLMTSNHKLDGIYLPPDDRRHFVAWSQVERTVFETDGDFWPRFWAWLGEGGGVGAVVAFLRELDLSGWDAKAPPPKTEAWHQIVGASTAPESAELDDAIDALGRPPVLTLEQVRDSVLLSDSSALAAELGDVRKRRQWVHRFGQSGYEPLRNELAKDGLWKIAGRRQVVYGRVDVELAEKRKIVGELIAKHFSAGA